MNIYWGETHDNTYQAPDPDFSMDRHLAAAQSHLDFYCGAYYPYTSPAFKKGKHPSEDPSRQPLNVEDWKDTEQINREWTLVKEAMKKFYRPGSFVTFPGYEWQGDGTWGDHNVFFHEDDPPLFRADTLEELYRAIRGRRVLAIPHHTAYIPGFRSKNWAVHEEALSPFMEVFSIHGSSEGEAFGGGLRSNPFLGPDTEAGTLTEALKAGRRMGIIASTDNWGPLPGIYGQGLAGVWARDLTRDDIWEAFTSRRVYGVTGDRISLRFDLEDNPMGSILPCPAAAPAFNVRVDALDRIDYIDFLRDEVLVDRFSPLDGDEPAVDSPGEYLFRLEYGWGPASNVMNLDAHRWSGRVRVQGADITAVTPCFISPEQTYSLEGRTFSFQGVTGQETAVRSVQNGYVLKLEGTADGTVEIEVNGLQLRTTLGRLSEGSTILWDREASAALIKEQFSVDTRGLYRKDVLFGMAYKSKIHRALRVPAFRRDVTFSDTRYDGRPHFYRVRVRQRNGQIAWSSPIWLV